MEVGGRIRELRAAAGMSQDDLAAAVGYLCARYGVQLLRGLLG